MAKTDLRIIRTRQNIHQAFLELCQKKPVSKITVTELAERAMINKGTFYLHYEDIYALYLEIIKETCMQIFDRIEDFSLFFRNPEEFVRQWHAASVSTDLAQIFPYFTPNELGVQIPAMFIAEFKNRIYDTEIIERIPENEIKIDCIILNLLVVWHNHYKKNPEITIKTMADIIRGIFQ